VLSCIVCESPLSFTAFSFLELAGDLHPPAPRLVCVELNPGPPKAAIAGISQLASALGSAIAKTVKKKKTAVKKKNLHPSRSSMGNISNPARLLRRSVPSAVGASFSRSGGEPITRIPFDAPTIYLVGGASNVITLSTTSSTGAQILDINPVNGTSGAPATSANMFGGGVASVSIAFSQFRITNLKIRYVGVVGTSSNGAIGLGYLRDSNFTSTFTVSSVTGCRPSIIAPIWSDDRKMDIPDFELWSYVYTDDSTNATDRMTSGGSLCVFNIGGTIVSGTTYGMLQVSGVVELIGLSNPANNSTWLARQGLLRPSLQDSICVCPSSSSSLSPPCVCRL